MRDEVVGGSINNCVFHRDAVSECGYEFTFRTVPNEFTSYPSALRVIQFNHLAIIIRP